LLRGFGVVGERLFEKSNQFTSFVAAAISFGILHRLERLAPARDPRGKQNRTLAGVCRLEENIPAARVTASGGIFGNLS
jgi:hypothetical protein